MAHFTESITWHRNISPNTLGTYLVQVHQLEEIIPSTDTAEPFIVDPEKEYISLAHWDGKRWDNIIIDNCISTDDANPSFRIKAWSGRNIS